MANKNIERTRERLAAFSGLIPRAAHVCRYAVNGKGAIKDMPTILRSGPYRFYFYSNEKGEPAHVHVQRERFVAKFWLQPVSLAGSKRFRSHELRAIQRIIEEHKDEFFGGVE